ncbi:hypothetical protein FMM05_08975 [Flavobacterium zepuense]|uniref:Uncharacterized protein n=1 Tax=Flavobacterium zepuense TaxID=2593302 RepID=A0A552V2E3_9FLAO|nr:hypothetical protein [Flavobacterium zepuense]TRW24636.1 hypothetical protein FMM05_08975 [Flavobacterium zepuense]
MFRNKIVLEEKFRLNVERLLYALVFTMVFEGLIRKLLPSAVGLLIFFLKDIFCITGLYFITKAFAKPNVQRNPFFNLRKIFFFVFLPPLIVTNFYDPSLVLFALKQYLLYMILALLVPLAFVPSKIERFKKFFFFFSLTIIPTTLVAVLQNSLPANHWLNQSVDGQSLEAFSAGGLLRVSSTFSFTGQYSWFLNVVCVILAVSFCLPIKRDNIIIKKIAPLLPLVISVCLAVGAFITGGRTAVLGCGLVLFLGFVFAVIKAPQKIITRGLILMAVMGLSLTALRIAKPEFFKVYDLRSEDKKDETHTEEVEGRILKDMFGWTVWIAEQDMIPFLFGNGLGVMSNGAERISSYAMSVRLQGISTESEIDSTAWEGGMYLVLIWFGMRIWVIIRCIGLWRQARETNNIIALSFLLGYITVIGLYGALSRQPPIAIWWWLSIGCFVALYNYDKNIQNIKV